MNSDFCQGFEKTSGILGGTLKTIGKGIWGLGKKMVTNVSPKGVHSIAPGKAAMSGIGAYFGASEIGNTLNKTKKTMREATSNLPSMRSASYFRAR